MTSDLHPTDPCGLSVEEVALEYLKALDAGASPDPNEYIRRYPHLEADLREFFAAQKECAALLTPLRHPAAAAPSATPSARRLGDYEILCEIARGGMGVVYRARQVSLDRTVALKMVRDSRLASADELRRFRTEAENAACLDHPNIVPVYEVGESDGQHYFSMKLIEGHNLTSLSREPRASADAQRRAAEIVATVARAVHHAHERGVLHRDLKPANILLDAKGAPYVTDFGLARRVEGHAGLTATGAVIGTPGFMAPEQAAGDTVLTTAADVFGLGAVFYSLLTGQSPFEGRTLAETILKAREGEPPSPRTLNPRADRDLETICLKCLQKEPGRRYPGALALAEDLERWQRGEPIAARPAGGVERLLKWARRRPAAAALCAVTATVLLAGAAALAAFVNHLDTERTRYEQLADRERKASEAAEERRLDAVHANSVTEEARRQSDSSRYALQIGEALAFLHAGDLAQARARLDECDPARRGWEHDYLSAACRRGLTPGNREIWYLTYRADGKQYAYVEPSSYVAAVCDAATGKVLHRFDAHHAISALGFSPDGARLSAASQAGFSAWDLRTGEALVHGRKMAWLPPVADPAQMRFAFTRDGKLLLEVSGTTLAVRDPATGQETRRVKLPEPHTLAFLPVSPDGKRVITSNGLQVRLWETAKWQQVAAWKLTGGAVSALLLRGDGREVAGIRRKPPTGGPGPDVQVWDALTGRLVMTVPVPEDSLISGLAYSPDGRQLLIAGLFRAAVGKAGWVKLWETETGREVATLRNINHFLSFALAPVFAPDGHGVLLPWANLARWEPEGTRPQTFTIPPGGRRAPGHGGVALLGDGRVAMGVHNLLTIWKPGRKEQPQKIPYRASAVLTALAVNETGTRLAVSARGHPMLGDLGGYDALRVYDFPGPAVRSRFSPGGELTAVALSSDGGLVAAGSEGSWIFIVDAATGKLLHTLRGHQKEGLARWPRTAVEGLAFAPRTKLLASAGRDRTIRLWDAAAGTSLHVLQGHRQPVMAVAFSSDGRFLASGGEAEDNDTGELKLWNAHTGHLLADLRGHTGSVRGLAFSPRDGRLASVGHDGTVRLWDVTTQRLVLTLPAHTRAGVALSFGRDGRRLVSFDQGGTVKVWEALPP